MGSQPVGASAKFVIKASGSPDWDMPAFDPKEPFSAYFFKLPLGSAVFVEDTTVLDKTGIAYALFDVNYDKVYYPKLVSFLDDTKYNKNNDLYGAIYCDRWDEFYLRSQPLLTTLQQDHPEFAWMQKHASMMKKMGLLK
jgi:hypothetical protein